jgi:hypothetical protein
MESMSVPNSVAGIKSSMIQPREVAMTLTHVKALVAKVITVGLLAGAFVMATPVKARAQGVSIGVHLGEPAYWPVYSGFGDGHRGYWEHERREAFERQQSFERQQAWLRQQEFLRHEAWEREHRFHGRDEHGYDRGYDRDRDENVRGGDRENFRR